MTIAKYTPSSTFDTPQLRLLFSCRAPLKFIKFRGINSFMARWRKSIPLTRRFVEAEFGRGMATAKIVNSSLPKKSTKLHEVQGNNERLAGLHEARGERRRKQTIFIAQKRPHVLVHEQTHAATSRKRSIHGLPPFSPAEEAVASSMELEWLKRDDPKSYSFLLKDGRELLNSEKKNLLSSYDAGLAAAALIERVMMKEDRAKIRKELSEEMFFSNSHMLRWVTKKCAKAQAKRGLRTLQ